MVSIMFGFSADKEVSASCVKRKDGRLSRSAVFAAS